MAPEPPRRTLAPLGLSPRKSLGQNFLADLNVARKIVELAQRFPPPFVEIGPGLGALTSLLAEAGTPVVAVEVDRGLAAHLRDRFGGGSVEIVEADFLAVPTQEWRRRFPMGGTVLGNLPYSVSSPIVLRLIELRDLFPRAVLMLQREMVDRLCAGPGGKEYGILSVYLGVLAEARKEFVVRRTCVHPSPDVDSAVMTVRFIGGPPGPPPRAGGRRCAPPPSLSSPGGRPGGATCSRRRGSIPPAGRRRYPPPRTSPSRGRSPGCSGKTGRARLQLTEDDRSEDPPLPCHRRADR